MHVVIVGGGTAGWLTAALGLALQPQNTYSVIESSQIGIIGVGESTTGFFTDLFGDLAVLGADHDDFMRQTGATAKLGIMHRDWRGSDQPSYFAPLDGSSTQTDPADLQFQWAHYHLPREQCAGVSHTGYVAVNGLSNQNSQGQWHSRGHAMHVDGVLTGQYLRGLCLRQANCDVLDTVITHFDRDAEGAITQLHTTAHTVIAGDLFVDCTGQARSLIGAMGAKWVSYGQHLPVDRGMPFATQHQPGITPPPWTTAWAHGHGWMWQTPLVSRRGNGMVYSSVTCSDDQAQALAEHMLGHAIDPIKIIRFDAGRQDSTWINNCVAIGLASSFLEPLEATSIHVTICQIRMLWQQHWADTPHNFTSPANVTLYNQRWSQQLDDLRDFLVMHYQGGRSDTEFWRHIGSGATQTDRVRQLLDISQHRWPAVNDWPRYWGMAGWSLWAWVMQGVGVFDHTPRPTCDWLDQEVNYWQAQQQLAQRYGSNRSHEQHMRSAHVAWQARCL